MKKILVSMGSGALFVIGVIVFGGLIIQALPFLIIPLLYMFVDDFLKAHISDEKARNIILWLILVPSIFSAFMIIQYVTGSNECYF